MRLDLNDDQRNLIEAVERVIGPPADPERCVDAFIYDTGLDTALADGGFFDLIENGYSVLDATLVALTIGRLPACVEATASLLLKPCVPAHYARPIAFMLDGQATPVRYLPVAKTLLIEHESEIRVVGMTEGSVEPAGTVFAFPYGRLVAGSTDRGEPLALAPGLFEARSRLAVTVDIVSAMQGALDRTVRQVKDRKQFGRPIGAFQAVQHRLAVAVQEVAGARLMACRAAQSGLVADANMALAYAQQHAKQLAYDFHQFSGAMGLTLEYPLHLWTYRMRALVAEYGGATRQASLVSQMTWPMAGCAVHVR